MNLQHKVAIVTGGALNIGLAISRAMAGAGARVVIADVAEDAGQAALRELGADYGGDHLFVKTNIMDAADVVALRDAAIQRYGRIDHLINNAAIAGPHAYVEDISLEEWRQSMGINLDGVFLACKYMAPVMKQQKEGNIVNIASVSGKRPLACRLPYCATKMGVIGLTRCLALELGPFGIRVNAVCPGAVESPRLELVLRRSAEQRGISYQQALDEKRATSPLQTLIPPSAVADAVAYLCGGEGAAMMTGEDVNVCAGSVMF